MTEPMNRTLPVDVYISAEHFEKEKKLIFERCWHNVGRLEEIPNQGDYFVRQIHPSRVSAIIVRGEGGEINAFHNVCSHRGSPVCRAKSGNVKTFVCPFHSWVYGIDGKLQRVPEMEAYNDLDITKLGLTPIAIDQWEGFIFVNLDDEPEQSLTEFLGAMPERLKGFPFNDLTGQNYRWSIELDSNWKIVRDAFVEGHHVRSVHPKTIADQFVSESNPFSHALIIEGHGLHGYMSLDQNTTFVPKPTEMIGVTRGLQLGKMPEQLPIGVNSTRNDNWVMDVNVIFPNFFVDLFEHAILTYRFIPLSAERTLWEVDMYFPDAPKTASERFYHEITMTRNRDALIEDVSIVEQIHQGFASGAKKEIVLHDEEYLISHLADAAAQYMETANA